VGGKRDEFDQNDVAPALRVAKKEVNIEFFTKIDF